MYLSVQTAFLLALFFISSAFARTELIICQQQSDQILDLYEATHLYQLQLDENLPSVKENAELFSEKMGRLLNIHPSQILSTVSSIQQRFVMFDLNSDKQPYGQCLLKQVTKDTDEDQILVEQQTWQKLSPFEQTAMVFHESFSALNSIYDRKFIAYLFSTTELAPVEKDVSRKNKMCAGGGNSLGVTFYIFPIAQGVQLQFWTLAGQNIFTQTYVQIPQFKFEWLESQKTKNQKGEANNLLTQSQVYNNIPIDFIWDIRGPIKKISVRVTKENQKIEVPLDCDY